MSEPFGLGGADIKFLDKDGFIIDSRPLESVLEYLKGTVMQFTGLLDKNGKEIYEGDIVRRPTGQIIDVRYFTYHSGEAAGQVYLIRGYQYTLEDEILGNIYETPELMK
jgi:hypothetical protein